ncbi:CAP domain [Phytophthora cactorum]|nr:CAP domain [Phytophthora cactorum]
MTFCCLRKVVSSAQFNFNHRWCPPSKILWHHKRGFLSVTASPTAAESHGSNARNFEGLPPTNQPFLTINFKGFFVIALVALVGIVNGEEADAVARELQIVRFSTKLANAINVKRAEKKLKAVCINTKLMRAALLLANDMAKNNFVSTRGSDGSTPTMRYNSQNSRTTKSAEMVAAGQTTVDVVVATWIKSAGAYLYSDLSSSASTTSTTAPSCASTTGCWTWPTRPPTKHFATTMNIKGLFTFALVALVGMTNAETAVHEDHVARELQVADFSKKLLDAVNAKRAEKGLKAVCINTKLAKAAQVLASDNAKNNKVTTKGSDGSTPSSRYSAQKIKTTQSAELVAAGQASVDAVVATWIKSSSAYLYSDLKFIGPGYAYDKTKTYKHYWLYNSLTFQIATQFQETPSIGRIRHAMNIKGLFAFAVIALVGMVNANAKNHVARELQVADFSTKLLNAVNAKRAEKGLKPVCINTKLAKAAQILADDNAKNNKVSTSGSDGSTPTSRYEAQGIDTAQSAEVAAAGQASADAVVATWIKSSSAYLFSDLKFIGPGYAYDKTKLYKHYWVMDMANADGEVCA